MKIVQRYILREFLVPLFYCLTGFLAIYVLFDLFGSLSRMLDAKLGIGMAALYFAGYLAPYFHYLVPAALMLATIYTMWTMCRHSELVALRASGISFLAIVRPLLFIAFVMALVVAGVSEFVMPRYANWATQLKSVKFDQASIKVADNVVYHNPEASRIWNVDELLAADASSLKSVRIAEDRSRGARLRTITADRADYLDGEWWLSGVHVQHHDDQGQEIASKTLQLDALDLRCFPGFTERPSDFIMQNRPWRFNSVSDRLRYLKTHPELTPERRNDLSYDLWAQVLAPFACLVITLFAIPAGIASGRQSVFKGIVGALVMFFGFYALMILCMIAAKNNWVPALPAALAPLVVYLALGIRAFLKQR